MTHGVAEWRRRPKVKATVTSPASAVAVAVVVGAYLVQGSGSD